MVKKYKSNRYSFDMRKQNYRAKHKNKGMDAFGDSFFARLLELFKSDIQRGVAILVSAVVVIAAILVVSLAKPAAAAAGNTAEPAPSAEETGGEETPLIEEPLQSVPEDYNAVSTETVDPDTLAGLTGEDAGIDDDTSGDISEAELKGAIGVVFDDVTGDKTAILQTIEEAAAQAIKDGKIGKVNYYDSKGDMN